MHKSPLGTTELRKNPKQNKILNGRHGIWEICVSQLCYWLEWFISFLCISFPLQFTLSLLFISKDLGDKDGFSLCLYCAQVIKNPVWKGFLRATVQKQQYKNNKTSHGFQASAAAANSSLLNLIFILKWSCTQRPRNTSSELVLFLDQEKETEAPQRVYASRSTASLSLHFWWRMTSTNIDLPVCFYFPGSTGDYGFLPYWKQQPWLNILAMSSKTDLTEPAAHPLYHGALTPSIKVTPVT